jgi:hypothetical protein
MPLQDRQDFQDWLARRTENRVGRRHGDAPVCASCGNIDDTIEGTECLVCLAESFGIETAEAWLAESVAGFVRAAGDPPVLARMLAELVVHARDIAALHAPPTTT